MVDDAMPFMDEWMPEDLRLLNRYAADYKKNILSLAKRVWITLRLKNYVKIWRMI